MSYRIECSVLMKDLLSRKCTHALTNAWPGLPVNPNPNPVPAVQYGMELHDTAAVPWHLYNGQ